MGRAMLAGIDCVVALDVNPAKRVDLNIGVVK